MADSRRSRRGQALMEMAVGMLTLVIVVSALAMFVKYIVRSLEAQNHDRGKPPPFKLEWSE